MTIAEALNVQQRSISQRDAEVLLQEVLHTSREALLANPQQSLSESQEKQILTSFERRERNEPVAYITGHKEFYGRSFQCDKRVLIPRPETEGLIDRALAWLPDLFKSNLKATNRPCPLHILELGTGSGNISITLALELAERRIPANFLATDISPEALEVAELNWQSLKGETSDQLARLSFIEADLFAHPLVPQKAPYDLIIANLPYVPTAWQADPAAQAEVVFYEPDLALFGGSDGLALYRRFFAEALKFLAPSGRILIEFGEDETPTLRALIQKTFPTHPISIYQDYAGLDRIAEIIS